jgi:hypothetical protein
MTAPDPQSSNTGQNHIAKRAPSRHDDAIHRPAMLCMGSECMTLAIPATAIGPLGVPYVCVMAFLNSSIDCAADGKVANVMDVKVKVKMVAKFRSDLETDIKLP